MACLCRRLLAGRLVDSTGSFTAQRKVHITKDVVVDGNVNVGSSISMQASSGVLTVASALVAGMNVSDTMQQYAVQLTQM
jgi:hypothetical protein